MVNGTLGNDTNNRLESLNGKIKTAIQRYNTLVQFIDALFEFEQCRAYEALHKKTKTILRQKVTDSNLTSDEKLYKLYLIEPVFNHVMKQITLSKRIQYKIEDAQEIKISIEFYDERIYTTPNQCSCKINKSWLLPCVHIFAARTCFNLSLFEKELCPDRWKQNDDILKPTDQETNSTPKMRRVKISEIASPKKLSESQKKNILSHVCKDIIFTGSKSSQKIFETTIKKLKKIQSDLYNGVSDLSLEEKSTKEINNNNSNEIETLSLNDLTIDSVKLPTPFRMIGRSKAALSISQNIL